MSGSAKLHSHQNMFDHASSLVKIEHVLPTHLNNLKVLDVGCGDARLSSNLLPLGANVVGFDIHQKALAKAKEKGLKTVLGDLEKPWTFANNQFDIVFLLDVLEHVVDIEHCLKESSRVLKPTGKIIIAFPNHFDLRNRLHILFGRGIIHWSHQKYEMEAWNYGHVRFLTYSQFTNLLAKFNLSLEIEQFNFMSGGILPSRFLPYFLKKFLMQFWPNLFSGKFIVRVKQNLNGSDKVKSTNQAPKPKRIYLGRTTLGI